MKEYIVIGRDHISETGDNLIITPMETLTDARELRSHLREVYHDVLIITRGEVETLSAFINALEPHHNE
jgi:hypothetical protein